MAHPSHRFSSDAFLLAPCAVVIVDDEGVIQGANATLSDWLGRSAAEIVGSSRMADLLTPGGQMHLETQLWPLLRVQGSFENAALRLRASDGSHRNVLASADRVVQSGGTATTTFVLLQGSLLRAGEGEPTLLRTADHTRASWLRQVESLAGVGAWMLDVRTGKLTWSDHMYRLYDLPLGPPSSLEEMMSLYEDPGRSQVRRSLELASATGEPFEFETPILTASGRRRIVRGRGEAQSEGGRIRRVVGVLQDVTEQHEVERRLWRSAHVDELSGLANRTWFGAHLAKRAEESRRDGPGFALVLIDLDGFKEVNDTLGHQAGDRVIRLVADRLRAATPEGVFLARLGGDEFALATDDALRGPHLEAMAERILARLRQPIRIDGEEAFVSASIGIALFPEQAADPDRLIQAADMALYDAKRAGRGTYRVFTPALRTAFDIKRRAIERVRQAAATGRLVVHYQPQVRLADGAPAGLEALVRVVNPDGSTSGPTEFWPALEDAEMARTIDDAVVRAVLRDLGAEGELGDRFGPVGINVSEHSLQRSGYTRRLLERLEASGVPPRLVQVEVLETVLLGRNTERLRLAFEDLRAAGVSLALDDFGTGFASLSHLRELAVDRIKIDRSFVGDVTGAGSGLRIVRPIVDLAHALGIKVVAEGVEQPETAEALRGVGCDEGQGFLFGRPVPCAALTRLFA